MGANKEFTKNVIELKRKKFFEIVYTVCKKRKLEMPELNFEGCEDETQDHLAHYHSEPSRICVSNRQLHMLNLEDIESTAAHEVGHMFEMSHDAHFHAEETTNKIATFNPHLAGMVVVRQRDSERIQKERPKRRDKTLCNFHACRKKRRLKRCVHCKDYFCSEHIQSETPEDAKWNKMVNAHVCVGLFDTLEKEKMQREKKYEKVLEKIASKNYMGSRSSIEEDDENTYREEVYEKLHAGRETVHTGGLKEFNYTKDDIKRIESDDTESTQSFKENLRRWRGSIKYNTKKLLRNISHQDSYDYGLLLKNFFTAIIVGVVMVIIYSNLDKLNSVGLFFVRLGSALMLFGLFFLLRYTFRTYRNLKHLVSIQKSSVKWALVAALLVLLFFAYQNKESLFDPVISLYEKIDFSIFNPFTFTLEEFQESVGIEKQQIGARK